MNRVYIDLLVLFLLLHINSSSLRISALLRTESFTGKVSLAKSTPAAAQRASLLAENVRFLAGLWLSQEFRRICSSCTSSREQFFHCSSSSSCVFVAAQTSSSRLLTAARSFKSRRAASPRRRARRSPPTATYVQFCVRFCAEEKR